MDTQRKFSSLRTLALVAILGLMTFSTAQKAPDKKKDSKEKEASAQEKKQPKPGEPKPYEEVITKEAVSQDGMFKVHRVDDKLYFEIPESMYGKELMWQAEMAQVPTEFNFPGTPAGTDVVAFTRRNNTIYLKRISHYLRSVDPGGMQTGVDAASVPVIINSFPVEAESKNKSAVIEVSKLFTTEQPAFFGKSGPTDPSKSYIDKVKAFPTNIETRAMISFVQPPDPWLAQFGFPATPLSVLAHYSLVQLPEKPMVGRYRDSRVGYFSQYFEVYGSPDNKVLNKAYIDRFRLEKKHPEMEVDEPVKPITFYMAREVPEKWRAWIKLGVEDWLPVFEKAGFKNAIVCREAPTVQEDPDWDPEDARYSVIRWAPSPIANAMGPSIQDPRSGETLSAHIIVWHNVLNLAQNWYFVQASASDPAAQKYPLSDATVGPLLRQIITHEVGHTLGLAHNMKASSSYSIAQLRDPKWTAENGNEASIMDYGRFNYVAQPGDGANLIPKIGPYDYFAIEWGYKPVPGATTPDQEKGTLDQIAARQVDNPMLRFGWRYEDPTVETEDLGSDPIEATRLGLLNIRRIAKNLLPATSRMGEDYANTDDLYMELQFQRLAELSHVAKLVGGVVETDYHAGRGGAVFEPLPRYRQAQAVKFLNDNCFTTPTELLDEDLLGRIRPSGGLSMVTMVQEMVLRSLLSESRVRRMCALEAARPDRAYTVHAMADDLKSGIWSELRLTAPKVDAYRRALQRTYLTVLDDRLNGMYAGDSELKGVEKDSLRKLAREIDVALPKVKDSATSVHLAECRSRIERIVKPTVVRNADNQSMMFFEFFANNKARSFCDPHYRGLTLEGMEEFLKPRQPQAPTRK